MTIFLIMLIVAMGSGAFLAKERPAIMSSLYSMSQMAQQPVIPVAQKPVAQKPIVQEPAVEKPKPPPKALPPPKEKQSQPLAVGAPVVVWQTSTALATTTLNCLTGKYYKVSLSIDAKIAFSGCVPGDVVYVDVIQKKANKNASFPQVGAYWVKGLGAASPSGTLNSDYLYTFSFERISTYTDKFGILKSYAYNNSFLVTTFIPPTQELKTSLGL